MQKNIVVTGGAGYCGSRLVPQLLDKGYNVTVYDIMYFGSDTLPLDHPNLKVVEGDIRDIQKITDAFMGCNTVIHLACISNDASFELDEYLSKTINFEAFEPMVLAAKNTGIQRFIYASSSSVYGVSKKPHVTEEHPLVPLTLYNKYKGMCEPILQTHTDNQFTGIIFRPATVCGYAPRQRLDLSVNILTNHAVTNGKIRVFGGKQLRPNLHIQDYCDLVELLIKAPINLVQGEVFNCGYQNMSIMEIALLVKDVVEEMLPRRGPISVVTEPTDDIRSYHINSEKISKTLGFIPKYSIKDAIRELVSVFQEGKLPNSMTDDKYYNVRTLKNRSVS